MWTKLSKVTIRNILFLSRENYLAIDSTRLQKIALILFSVNFELQIVSQVEKNF